MCSFCPECTGGLTFLALIPTTTCEVSVVILNRYRVTEVQQVSVTGTSSRAWTWSMCLDSGPWVCNHCIKLLPSYNKCNILLVKVRWHKCVECGKLNVHSPPPPTPTFQYIPAWMARLHFLFSQLYWTMILWRYPDFIRSQGQVIIL